MKNVLWQAFAKTVLPSLLGAGGALVATMVPAYHAAFCGGLPGLL